MRVHLPGDESAFPSFIKCLKSLPNLHTLEIGRIAGFSSTSLQRTLQGIKLPQIKTLILPPAAYPLLQPCWNVEDVACVVGYHEILFDMFFRSLASNRYLRVKRLVIPLVLRDDTSRK